MSFGEKKTNIRSNQTIHKHCSLYYSELHFTLITEHQQSVTSGADHIPVSEFIDCPDNISTSLNGHIVLSIMLPCVCVCLRPRAITLFTVMCSPGVQEPDRHIWANIDQCQLSSTPLSLSQQFIHVLQPCSPFTAPTVLFRQKNRIFLIKIYYYFNNFQQFSWKRKNQPVIYPLNMLSAQPKSSCAFKHHKLITTQKKTIASGYICFITMNKARVVYSEIILAKILACHRYIVSDILYVITV